MRTAMQWDMHEYFLTIIQYAIGTVVTFIMHIYVGIYRVV